MRWRVLVSGLVLAVGSASAQKHSYSTPPRPSSSPREKARPPAPSPTSTPTPAPLTRSQSASRQFVIYHSDGTMRAKVARKVEDIKTDWLRSLGLSDDWKSPVIIQLHTLAPPGAPRLRTGLFLADGAETKVQVDVFDLGVLRGGEFDREIYRALLLELMYRDNPPKEGKTYQQPPIWLLDALGEDARARTGEGIAAGLYERIVEGGPPPKLEAFLKERPEMMDATTRAIFRARAMALLRALLALPDGPSGMAAWIKSLPGINPADAGKLTTQFPSLSADPSGLSKQWTLALANASASNRAEALSVAATVRFLNQIFDMGAPLDPKKPNENLVSGPPSLPLIARAKSGKYVLNQKAEELLRLQVRAHPLIRPIVEEYHLIVAELAVKPKRNLDKRIAANMELQKAITERSGQIEDYLNWFEAAKLETPSREFDLLLEMPSGDGSRNDPITRHMNDLEARGW